MTVASTLIGTCRPQFLVQVNRYRMKLPKYCTMKLSWCFTPGDIVCLRPNSDDITLPSKGIWKHNPLDGLGTIGPQNRRIYKTAEMGGVMEPHVFARFRCIKFKLSFDFFPGKNSRYRGLGIGPDLKIERKECIRFQNFLRRTNILRDFVKVLSKSILIKWFEIEIHLRALPGRAEDVKNADGSLDDKYFIAVDARAAEMLIESGILDPLRNLPNVCTALVKVIQAWTLEEQTLEPKHKQLLRELEDDIEDSWDWDLSEDEDFEEENAGY